MRTYTTIVLHCTATPPSMDVGVIWVDKLHKARGWSQCGYHYIIRRDGTIERGRPVWMQGAHVKGHNDYTIGVAYSGGVDEDGAPEDNLTAEQYEAVKHLVTNLRLVFGPLDLLGHRDLPNVKKACPSFDVREKFGTFVNEWTLKHRSQ